MRVELKPVQQGMVKKKHRLRKQQRDANEFPDSSDEGGAEGPLCVHVNKSVNLNLVKKAVKNYGVVVECMTCKSESSNESTKRTDQEEATNNMADQVEITMWLCLQCGNQGCDRNSKYKHALKHYETPRTGSHDLCLNLSTYIVWCYSCDNEVALDSNKKLAECVEYVKKQFSASTTGHQHHIHLCPHSVKRSSHQKAIPEPSGEDLSQDKEQKVDNQNRVKSGSGQSLSLPKVKGLSNLGNTCFFNAVMQNISQTPILASVLSERVPKGFSMQLSARRMSCDTDSDESAHNSGEEDKESKPMELSTLNITLGDSGMLSSSVLSFMKDMHNSTSKGSVVTPSSLFGQVCKKTPRFKGFQQQDSHELLRCLLDGMKAEEVKRSQAGILNAFSLPMNLNNRVVDEETKAKVKGYGSQVKHTFVDSVFGGLFISTVQCEECKIPSQIFEPFLDVSLPVTEEKTIRPSNFLRKKSEQNKNHSSRTEEEVVLPVNGKYGKNPKPSKHQSKKAQKKAKKDAKRGKRKSSDCQDGGEGQDKATEDKVVVEDEGEESEEDEDVQLDKQVVVDDKDNNQDDKDINQDDKDVKLDVQQNDNIMQKDKDAGQDKDVPQHNNEVNLDDMECAELADSLDIYNYNCEEVDENIGLSLQNLELKDQDRDNDQDSNRAIGSNSEDNLSDSDADVEDNLDLTRTSPIEENVQIAKEDSTNDILKTLPATQTDIVDINVKTQCKERTSQSDSVLNKFTQPNSGLNCETQSSCSNVKREDTVDKKLIKDNCNRTVNGILPDITENFKRLSVSADKNDVELEAFNDNNNADMPPGGNLMQKIGFKNSVQNSTSSSRANTPSSPTTLSRNSSFRHSNNFKSPKYQVKLEAKQEAMKILAPTRYQPSSHECSVQSCLNQFTACELLTGTNKFGCENCSKRRNTGTDKEGKKEMVYTNASKQVLIFSPPAVLTLHMKRFQQVGYSLRKVNRHVDFPMVLDLAPYCSSLSQGVKANQTKVLYSLYGIVEHSGRLSGGHYTAFVKVRPNMSHNVKAFLQMNSLYGLKVDKVLVESLEAMRGSHEAGAVGGVESEEGVVPPPGKWYYISDSRVSETTESNVLRCQAYLLFYERIY